MASIFGKQRAALRFLTRAPIQSAEVKFRLGRLYERSGRLEDAFQSYKKASKLDSDYAPARHAANRTRSALGIVCLQRGMQLYRSGEYYLAGRQLTKAVHYGACSEKGYRALARISERRGSLTKAAEYWDTVCKLNPSAVRPHYKAATLHLARGRVSKAYHHAVKARDLHARPEPHEDISSDDIRALLGEVSSSCIKLGSIDVSRATSIRSISEKIVWLDRATNLKPSPAIYIRLARYYDRLGQLSSGDRRANYRAMAAKYRTKAGQ
jgi:tetratricopeptide (TPR) repeat protein